MRKFFVFDHLSSDPSRPIPVPAEIVGECKLIEWLETTYVHATMWYSEVPDVEYCTFRSVIPK